MTPHAPGCQRGPAHRRPAALDRQPPGPVWARAVPANTCRQVSTGCRALMLANPFPPALPLVPPHSPPTWDPTALLPSCLLPPASAPQPAARPPSAPGRPYKCIHVHQGAQSRGRQVRARSQQGAGTGGQVDAGSSDPAGIPFLASTLAPPTWAPSDLLPACAPPHFAASSRAATAVRTCVYIQVHLQQSRP